MNHIMLYKFTLDDNKVFYFEKLPEGFDRMDRNIQMVMFFKDEEGNIIDEEGNKTDIVIEHVGE